MKLLRSIRNYIKSNDLFYSNQMLRFENQLQYKSLTGGIISLAIIATTLVGFANMIILTLQREQINSSKTIIKNSDPPLMSVKVAAENNFMMGFEVQGIDLLAYFQYFNVNLMKATRSRGNIISHQTVPIQKCTKEHWSRFPQVIDNFDSLNVSNWVCPSIGFDLELQGKILSEKSIQYTFSVQQCNKSSSQTSICASKQAIEALFKTFNNQLILTFYYINPMINENNKDYVLYFLQDYNFIIFGDKIGSEANFYFSDYNIKTDYSIWPFQSLAEQQGSLIQSFWTKTPFQVSEDIDNRRYALIHLFKSTNSIFYKRQVQKISTVFSFIGGMISALSAVLSIIKIYNSQAFQIQIASAIFTQSPEKQELERNNFFTYLKYNVYKFFKFIGCRSFGQNYSVLQNCIQEIGKQLDVKSLIQRIIFLQYSLGFLFEDYQLLSLQAKRPSSLLNIKKARQRCSENQDENQDAISNKQCQPGSTQINGQDENGSAYNFKANQNLDNQGDSNIRMNPSPNLGVKNILIQDVISQIPQKQIRVSNKVADSYFQYTKSQSLANLQQNASKGDRISLRIYHHLYPQAK